MEGQEKILQETEEKEIEVYNPGNDDEWSSDGDIEKQEKKFNINEE
jgi:hypothetical protein